MKSLAYHVYLHEEEKD